MSHFQIWRFWGYMKSWLHLASFQMEWICYPHMGGLIYLQVIVKCLCAAHRLPSKLNQESLRSSRHLIVIYPRPSQNSDQMKSIWTSYPQYWGFYTWHDRTTHNHGPARYPHFMTLDCCCFEILLVVPYFHGQNASFSFTYLLQWCFT